MLESYDSAEQCHDKITYNTNTQVKATNNTEDCRLEDQGHVQYLLKDASSDGVRKKEGRQLKHPVDSGYAWIVLLAAFGLKFLVIGYIKALGIFFMEFQERFGSNSSMISLTLGVMELAVSLGSYLVMTFLMKVASPRTSCLIGSVFLAIGVAGNAWFAKVELLILTQGVFYGAAVAFMFGPPVISVMQYFNKRRALASSISECGGSLGGVVLPGLCRLLFDEYSFSGGTLLTAGVMMHAFVCSSLLTPVELYSTNSSSRNKTCGRIKALDCILNCLHFNNKGLIKNNNFQKEDLTNSSLVNVSIQEGVLQRTWSDETSGGVDQSVSLLESSLPQETPQAELERHLRQDDTHATNSPYEASENIVPPQFKSRWFTGQRSVYLHSASFWVLSLFFFSGSIGTVLSQTYIPLLAAERGLSATECAYFLSILNILDIPAHLIPGIIVTFGLIGPAKVCILPIIAVGLISCLTPFILDYSSVLSMFVIHGLFNGTFYVMQPLIVITVLGQEHLVTAMGIFIVLGGMSTAVSYPICGALRDVTGTYSSTFIFLGMTGLFASAILTVIPLAKRYDARRGVLKMDN